MGVQGESNMCEALRDLMKDEIEKEITAATDKLTAEVTDKVTAAVTDKVQRDERIKSIKNAMDGFKVSAKEAIEKLGLDYDTYGKYFSE